MKKTSKKLYQVVTCCTDGEDEWPSELYACRSEAVDRAYNDAIRCCDDRYFVELRVYDVDIGDGFVDLADFIRAYNDDNVVAIALVDSSSCFSFYNLLDFKRSKAIRERLALTTTAFKAVADIDSGKGL